MYDGSLNYVSSQQKGTIDCLEIKCCNAVFVACSGKTMRTIVERVLRNYDPIKTFDQSQVAESRERILRYFEKLAIAGLTDADQLIEYGTVYLKELHEGPDKRFTGC
jgi:hypothetical protein